MSQTAKGAAERLLKRSGFLEKKRAALPPRLDPMRPRTRGNPALSGNGCVLRRLAAGLSSRLSPLRSRRSLHNTPQGWLGTL